MIKIENEQLANYLMFKLDKLENEFTEEELGSIDELVINPFDINGDFFAINLDVIKYFTGVKKISLFNLYLTEIDISNLSELKFLESFSMEKCDFENADLLLNLHLKEIELINCNINDYSFLYKMKNLNSVSILNGNISLKEINNLDKLEYLQLSCSNINEIAPLKLEVLRKLFIDNTPIEDLSIIENLNNLDTLIISENQYTKNKTIIGALNKRGILVLDENLMEFEDGGDLDE